MYERFTDRARTVMKLANQEAKRFNHEYIGTEHVLLGLIKEGGGVAANVLKRLGIDDLAALRSEVEKLIVRGPGIAVRSALKRLAPKKSSNTQWTRAGTSTTITWAPSISCWA